MPTPDEKNPPKTIHDHPVYRDRGVVLTRVPVDADGTDFTCDGCKEVVYGYSKVSSYKYIIKSAAGTTAEAEAAFLHTRCALAGRHEMLMNDGYPELFFDKFLEQGHSGNSTTPCGDPNCLDEAGGKKTTRKKTTRKKTTHGFVFHSGNGRAGVSIHPYCGRVPTDDEHERFHSKRPPNQGRGRPN